MQIKQFSPKYADEMAQLFVDLYSDEKKEWDLPTAKAYLARNYEAFPEINFMAIHDSKESNDENELMGAVFCQLVPYYKGKMLFIDSLQVKPNFREQGVAKNLLLEVIKKAKTINCNGFYLMADMRTDFPRKWYEGMGFEKTGWAEYKTSIDGIKL